MLTRLKETALLFSLTFSISVYSQLELAEVIFKNQESDAVAIGDLDNDGRPDILTSNLVWYKNMSDGLYEKAKSIIPINLETTRFVKSLVIIDFDSDGDQDIFAGYYNGAKVTYFENLGGGNFSEEQIVALYPEEESVREIDVVDLDEDGHLDLLVLNYSGSDLTWCRNLGDGTLTDPITISTILSLGSDLEINDVDLDGDIDILTISRGDNKLRLFENLGGGSFAEGVIIPSLFAQLKRINCVDIDADTDLDLIVSTGSSRLIYSFENLGDGTFDTPDTVYIDIEDPLSHSDHEILSFDIDNDGDKDLISRAQFYNLIMFNNLGDGTYGPPIEISPEIPLIGSSRVPMIHGDMNIDGYEDLIINEIGNWRFDWYENDEGSFNTDTITIPWMDGSKHYRIFDYDNDGDQDALIASYSDYSIWLFENLGDGIFGNLQKKAEVEDLIEELLIVDIDMDGKLDVAFSYRNEPLDKLGWIRNLGEGNFSDFKLVGNAADISSISATDIDSDGDKDLFITLEDGGIRWYETFVFSEDPYPVNLIPISTDYVGYSNFMDADEDGDEDLLYVYESLDVNRLVYKKNDGDGTFSSTKTISTEVQGEYFIADFDGDGLDDICFEYPDEDGIGWVRNLPGPEFGEVNDIFSGTEITPMTTTPADLDQDGAMDILFAYIFDSGSEVEGRISWIRNSGGGIFLPPVDLFEPDQTPTLEYLEMGFEDMNNDGIKELTVAHQWYFRSDMFWFGNFYPETNEISGYVFADMNENGIFDDTDTEISAIAVFSEPNDEISISNDAGKYAFAIGGASETYEIHPDEIDYWTLTTLPSHTISVDTTFAHYDSLNFGFFPDTIVNELEISLDEVYLNCGDTSKLCINVKNVGTTLPSGIIHLSLDDDLSFLDADLSPDSVVGNNVYWNYNELNYFSNEKIVVFVLTPDADFDEPELTSNLDVSVMELEEILTNFTDSLVQLFECNPLGNRKTVEPSGFGDNGLIPLETEQLSYNIYFQNTTGDTVENVIIIDQIDPLLDLSSVEILGSSHPVDVSIYDSILQFDITAIDLPDSSQNFPESIGFVKFALPIESTITINDSIRNSARVLFDGTNTKLTDTTLNTFYHCDSILMDIIIPTEIFPFDSLCNDHEMISLEGFPVEGEFSGPGIIETNFDPSTAGIGIHIANYYYETEIGCSTSVQDTIIVFDCIGLTLHAPEKNDQIMVYPNPTNGDVRIEFSDENPENCLVKILDMNGKLIYQKEGFSKGVLTIKAENLVKGTYLLKIFSADSTPIHNELLIVN